MGDGIPTGERQSKWWVSNLISGRLPFPTEVVYQFTPAFVIIFKLQGQNTTTKAINERIHLIGLTPSEGESPQEQSEDMVARRSESVHLRQAGGGDSYLGLARAFGSLSGNTSTRPHLLILLSCFHQQ